jgi:peptidoglycan biosynthesis protein MviN/MurJ (putative lipid II flippase)
MRSQLITVGLLTGLSQATAFLKLWFVAKVFGIGSELDGYNLALVVPTFVAAIISSLIQTGFFPTRSAFKLQADKEQLQKFERNVIWSSATIGILVSAVVVLAQSWILVYLVSDRYVETLGVIEKIFPFVATVIALNILVDTMGYVLAMYDRFAYAAAAPIINGLIGAIFLLIWPEYGIDSLVAGTILGIVGQLIVCTLGLKSIKFSIIGPMLSRVVFFPEVKKMVRLSFWILPGVVFSNITTSLPMIWAAQFGEGVASTFGYAYRLHTSIVQLLVMASSTIILAHFSTLIANSEGAQIRRFLVNSAIVSFLIGGFGVVVIWSVGPKILVEIFSGKFDADAALNVSNMWMWLTVGLAFTLLGNVFAKLWQAQGNAKQMSLVAGFTLLLFLSTFSLTKDMLHESSISISLSISATFVVLIGVLQIRFKNKFKS